jgi:DNA-binding NarL/FixJ family response regulator
MEVVGEAGDAEDLIRKVRAHEPDVAIVDSHAGSVPSSNRSLSDHRGYTSHRLPRTRPGLRAGIRAA